MNHIFRTARDRVAADPLPVDVISLVLVDGHIKNTQAADVVKKCDPWDGSAFIFPISSAIARVWAGSKHEGGIHGAIPHAGNHR